ncbi:thiol-disulfide oxidoreductase DCC family protein [Glaciecola siphonariae]|uniref:Thiol-disulfide oxidoreductase DCC family protein n=1 Tax=Glaciecola siphonariae TaxID=521012 RepID=A0ABV9M1A3_9ALTE
MAFTIFYDGQCPLCDIEMRHLKKRNTARQLAFEDINADDFSVRFPQLDWQALNNRIHGMEADGTLLIGLDVTHRAWSLVGYKWLYAPLRWPVIRFFADRAYLIFAKHRNTISYWLTGKKRCESNCGIKY